LKEIEPTGAHVLGGRDAVILSVGRLVSGLGGGRWRRRRPNVRRRTWHRRGGFLWRKVFHFVTKWV